MASSRLLRLLEGSSENTFEQSERIVEILDPFVRAGFVLHGCDLPGLVATNATIDDLEKGCRFLYGFIDEGVLGDLCSFANTGGVIASAQSLTIKSILRLQWWLNTTNGRTYISQVQTRKKLQKEAAGKGKFSARETSLLRLFNQQCVDHSAKVKKTQTETDAAIAELQSQIAALREAKQKKMERLKLRYPVASSFETPANTVIRERAWAIYLATCEEEGKVPVVKTSDNLAVVTDEFRSQVMEGLQSEHCNIRAHADLLVKYGKRKLKKLSNKRKRREVETFRGLIAAATGSIVSTC